VTYECGDKSIVWQCRSWMGKMASDPQHDIAIYGEKGALLIKGGGYSLTDPAGREIAAGTGPGGDATHTQNFLNAIRSDEKLNAEIEEGHKSTLMCHLGNIAHRVSRPLALDPSTRKIANDEHAMALWSREYRKGWEPKV
jgi:hypothetical protein